MSKIKNFFASLLPKAEDTTSEKARKAVFISAVIIFIIAAIILTCVLVEQNKNKQLRDELADIYNPTGSEAVTSQTEQSEQTDESSPTITEPLETIVNDNGETEYVATVMTAPEINLSGVERLLAINPDTVGWVQIPNTEINNVVVQSDDNDEYLDKSFYGASAKAGTIFADHRCVLGEDVQSDNIVLYGHNQHDGTMLGDLHNYKGNVWYYREHPTVNFNTNYASGTYKIFAYFVTNASPLGDEPVFNYHDYINLSDESAFNWYLGEIMKRNQIITNVDVKYGDKLLTLSTCSTEFADSRFVVFARKLREGESLSISMTGVQLNEGAVRPDWSNSSSDSTVDASSDVNTSATTAAASTAVTSTAKSSASAAQDSSTNTKSTDSTDTTDTDTAAEETTQSSRKYL